MRLVPPEVLEPARVVLFKDFKPLLVHLKPDFWDFWDSDLNLSAWRKKNRDAYFFVWPPPPRLGGGSIISWGIIWLKGVEKWGVTRVTAYLPPSVKKYSYFSPIDLKSWNTQKSTKKAEIFHQQRLPPYYHKFHLGRKNINEVGGGTKIWISNIIYTPETPNYLMIREDTH